MRLSRYRRRFGGAGTIVTLADGRAFTAAHCLAAVDGRPGTLVDSADGSAWRVDRRWSPRGCDLAMLTAISTTATAGAQGPAAALAMREVLRAGLDVVFCGHTARGFRRRRARVVSATETNAVAEVLSRSGVRAGDSGGPVLLGKTLVGIVTHRAGPARALRASAQLVFTRLDSPLMRARLRRYVAPGTNLDG